LKLSTSSTTPNGLCPIKSTDVEAIEIMKEFEEFAPYAIGIYGWRMQAVLNPFQCMLKFPVDLCYGADQTVFTREIEAIDKTKRQILYSSFTSYLGEAIPYTITVDHERKAVVIALRYVFFTVTIETDI
jgi:hypothetical protein